VTGKDPQTETTIENNESVAEGVRDANGVDSAIPSLERAVVSKGCLSVDISTRRCAPTRLLRVHVDGPMAAKLLLQDVEELTP
jgi:hypothetical protein